MKESSVKEKIGGVVAGLGVLVVLAEILYNIYKWFGMHPVIFIVGIILMIIGVGLNTEQRW